MRRAEMNPGDAILAKEADVLVTVDNIRIKWLTLLDLEINYDVKTKEVSAVGNTVNSYKVTGVGIPWSARGYKVDSVAQDAVQKYIETGVFPEITIQCTNDDPAAAEIGRSTVVANGCVFNGNVLLAKAASNDDFVEQSLSGFARNVTFPEKQRTPGYML